MTPHAATQVNKMRVDMIRGSMAAPESIMRILSDYPQEQQQVSRRASPTFSTLHILDLDLVHMASCLG